MHAFQRGLCWSAPVRARAAGEGRGGLAASARASASRRGRRPPGLPEKRARVGQGPHRLRRGTEFFSMMIFPGSVKSPVRRLRQGPHRLRRENRDLPAASRNPHPFFSKRPPRRAQARAASTSPTSSASSTPATPPSTPTPPPAAGRLPCAGPAPTARPQGPRRIGASPNPSRACGGAQAARPLWVRDAARGTHARNTGAKRTHTSHAHKHTRARAHTHARTRASIPCVSRCGGRAVLPSPETGHGLVSVTGMGQCLWKKSKGCIIE